MNRILKFIGIFLSIVAIMTLNACKDDISPVIEELQFDRVFTPLQLEAKISNQTTVSLSWAVNKGIESYVVEISDDSLQFANLIHTATITPDQIPYVYELPAGNTQYSVRVKGTSSEIEDSKWAALAFKSLPENLFNGYDIVMTAIGEITIKWVPGKNVSSMLFISENGETSFDITSEEQAAGVKHFSDLPNADYEIKILNEGKARGTQNYILEGDVFVETGADLASAISAASPGDVLILDQGASFGFEGDMFLEKSIKLKGLDGQMPVLYVTSGVKMFEIGANLTPADELIFENLYLSGYMNNNSAEGQIRGIFDMENDPCNVGAIKFIGCKIYNVGRQVVRLRGGADQTIGEFVVDDCIVHDLGRASGSYGIFCATETNTNAKIVRISNSTIDSLKCHFIRYDDPVDCESIIVENCTFHKTPFSSGRYLMDVRNAVISNGIEVSNCIFGNNTYGDDPSISGIRAAEGVSVTITNSYATTDFVNTGYSILDFLTPLGVSSDQLWNDPENVDFTFKFDVIQAGDPRWRIGL